MCLARVAPPAVLSLILAGGCASPVDQPTAPSLAKATSGPTVTATSPSASVRDTTLVVEVLGSGFDNGSQVQFLLSGAADPKVVTDNVAFVNSTRLDATVTIAGDALAAYRDVAVTTSGGKKGIGTDKFQVLAVERLAGPGGGFALGVGGGGLVVGRIEGGCHGQVPALWDQAGTLTFLPLPPEGCSGGATGISRNGLIVGMIRTDPTNAGRWSVGRWSPGGTSYLPEFLGYWIDGSNIEPNGINASGNITATAYPSGGSIALWRSATGGWVQLPIASGAIRCVANGLNESDRIAGGCYFGSLKNPVVWPDPTTAPIVLPRLANYAYHQGAVGVNGAGDVAGYAWNRSKSGSIQEMATRWHFDGTAWQVESLGHLGGGVSTATAIDEDGAIVGWSRTGGANGPLAAFVWRAGAGMKELPGLGNESQALGVRTDPATGQIVVGGTNINGTWRPVRWRP